MFAFAIKEHKNQSGMQTIKNWFDRYVYYIVFSKLTPRSTVVVEIILVSLPL
jgi:hypothetical protein